MLHFEQTVCGNHKWDQILFHLFPWPEARIAPHSEDTCAWAVGHQGGLRRLFKGTDHEGWFGEWEESKSAGIIQKLIFLLSQALCFVKPLMNLLWIYEFMRLLWPCRNCKQVFRAQGFLSSWIAYFVLLTGTSNLSDTPFDTENSCYQY